MNFNYNNIVKDVNPIVREKSQNVQLPLSTEDRELLQNMLQYE